MAGHTDYMHAVAVAPMARKLFTGGEVSRREGCKLWRVRVCVCVCMCVACARD